MTEKEISQKITQYINGQLTDQEIDQLWEEFLKNPATFDLFETELNLYDLFQSKNYSSHGNTQSISRSPMRRYQKWIYAAAAAVLISIGLQFFSMSGEYSISELALTSIEPTEMIGADVFRSDAEIAEEIDLAINNSLANALKNENEEARMILLDLLPKDLSNKQSASVYLNLGILEYNKQEYLSSVDRFNRLLEVPDLPLYFEEKAYWFSGNAFINLQQYQAARQAIYNAYMLDGKFSEPAGNILRRLEMELNKSEPTPAD